MKNYSVCDLSEISKMEMCSVSVRASLVPRRGLGMRLCQGSVSVLFGSILMDCSLQQFNDLLHENEMSLQERDKLIQSRALLLPVAGRIWQSPEQSSHTVQHIENSHSRQDKTEKDQSFLPHFLREGWHHSPVAHSPVPQTHLVPPADHEGGGVTFMYKRPKRVNDYIVL